MGEDDPELFPGRAVARLSDYAKIVKRLESGDVACTFAEYDLDFTTWSAAAHAWGKALSKDRRLLEKLERLLESGAAAAADTRPWNEEANDEDQDEGESGSELRHQLPVLSGRR